MTKITAFSFEDLEGYWADTASVARKYLRFYQAPPAPGPMFINPVPGTLADWVDQGDRDDSSSKKSYGVSVQDGIAAFDGKSYELYETDAGKELRPTPDGTTYHKMDQVVSVTIKATDYVYQKQQPTVEMTSTSATEPTVTVDTINVLPGTTLLLRYDIQGQGAFLSGTEYITWGQDEKGAQPNHVTAVRLSDTAVLIFDQNPYEKEPDTSGQGASQPKPDISYIFNLYGTDGKGGKKKIDPTIVNKGTSSPGQG